MAVVVDNMSIANVNISDTPDDVDIFDSVVMLEESSVKAGFSAGLNHGSEKGQQNGYQLGHSMGCNVGNEIGFLKGFISTWLALLDETADTKQKSYKALTSLQTLLNKYLLGRVDNTCVTDLKMIQAKFKKEKYTGGKEVDFAHVIFTKYEIGNSAMAKTSRGIFTKYEIHGEDMLEWDRTVISLLGVNVNWSTVAAKQEDLSF